MKLKQFDYNLPKELIATEPASPRDAARLLIYNKLDKICVHEKFYNIGKFLDKGDILVLNDTKVIPARLLGRRIDESGAQGRKFKILLLEKKKPDVWTCLIDGKGRQEGLKIFFGNYHNYHDRDSYGRRGFGGLGLRGEVVKKIGGGIWEIKFNKSGKALDDLIFKLGEMPLPPYIKQGIHSSSEFGATAPNSDDRYKQKNKDWYQTVFAKYAGSAAAPTAGLHFTPRLLSRLKKQGIEIEYVTLHVGMGTFMPVKAEKIEEHKMHKELAIISPKTAAALNKAKKEGRRVIACGTTAARTLESFVSAGKIRSGKKYTGIFIYPPYKFKFSDALITNFHLPKSTLLMLVSAFLSEGDKKGVGKMKELYAEAIKKKYRFYSYGDAMLII